MGEEERGERRERREKVKIRKLTMFRRHTFVRLSIFAHSVVLGGFVHLLRLCGTSLLSLLYSSFVIVTET